MKNVNFLGEGATHGEGEVGEGCVEFFQENPTLAMWLANINWLGVLGKMLAGVKSWVMVKKVNFLGATYGEREVGEGVDKLF